MPRQTASNTPAPVTPVVERPTDIAAWTTAIVGPALSLRGVAAAELMQRLRLDDDSVAAAYLTALPSDADTDALVLQTFGPSVAQLFVGVHRMASMQGLSKAADNAVTAAQQAQQTEALRKMLLAMVDDVRVVLIKLAERLVSLRSAELSTEARRTESAQAEARQVMDIFAPLANRLGVWQIKWELEDLSLRLLQPTQYHHANAAPAKKPTWAS